MAVAMAVRMPKQSARLAATLNSPPLTWIRHSAALRKGIMPGSRRWTRAPSERKSRSASFGIFNPLMAFPSSLVLSSCTRNLLHVGQNAGRRPFVAGIEFHYVAIGPDQSGGQRVCNGAIRGRREAHIKILRHLFEDGLFGDRKIPLRKSLFGV